MLIVYSSNTKMAGLFKILSPAPCAVLQLGGTEPPIIPPPLHEKPAEIFRCTGCALPLYSLAKKYDSSPDGPGIWDPPATCDRETRRRQLRHRADGGALPPVRRPSRARFPGRAAATRLRYRMNGAASAFTSAVS